MPDLKDYEAVQKFFIQEVQLGEELLAQGNIKRELPFENWNWHFLGDIETGIEHLSNAVAVCGQPQQLLGVLQQTLPPQVFNMLLQQLPIVSQVFDRVVKVFAYAVIMILISKNLLKMIHFKILYKLNPFV